MGKSVFVAGLAMSLVFASMANASAGGLDSLTVDPVENVTVGTLWADMDAGADSLWAELSADVEKQRAYYFNPTGPADRHWSERGVDMGVLLDQASKGSSAAVLYSDDPEGPVLQALSARAMAGLASEWDLMTERRFAARGETAFVNMLALTSAHLLVSEESWERMGNGYCPKSQAPAPADHMAVYRDSRVTFDAASAEAGGGEGAAFSMWTALSRMPTPRVCWIYVETSPGVYETRSFDAEGRPLGNMDEGTRRLRIVPVTDLRAMLTAPMERRKNQDSASAQ